MQAGGAILALEAQGLDIGAHMGGIAGRDDNALDAWQRIMALCCSIMKMKLAGAFPGYQCRPFAGHLGRGKVEQIRAGAASVMAGLAGAAEDYAPLLGAATQLAYGGGAQYFSDDGLCRLAGEAGFWYRQLWAESLGKEGKGSVPVNALGPVDQHSQMQLYMAGPDDKFYTLLSHQRRHRHRRAPILPMMKRRHWPVTQ